MNNIREISPGYVAPALRERPDGTLVIGPLVRLNQEAPFAEAAVSLRDEPHVPLRSSPPIPGAPGAGGGRGAYEGLRPLFLYVAAVLAIALAGLVLWAGVGR